MKQCIIFSRVSTEAQSLESQTQVLQERAVQYLYPIESHIIIQDTESGISLAESERIGLEKLKAAINSNPDVSCIFTWEISRISRRPAVIYSIRDFLVSKKVRWINITPEVEIVDIDGKTSQTSSLILAMYSSFAESEMLIKKERAKRGIAHAKEVGTILGGDALRGYKPNRKTKRYEIDAKESKFIRLIFSMYSTGRWSLRSLAKELKERGYFQETALHSVPAIIGSWINDTRYIGSSPSYEAIISEEMFNRCKEITASHQKVIRTANKGEMLAKGIIFSAATGYSLNPIPSKGQYKTHPDYKPSVSVMQKFLDPLISDFTQMIMNQYFRDSKKIKRDIDVAERLYIKKIAAATLEQMKAKQKLERVQESYIEGKITKEKADALSLKYKGQIKDSEDYLNTLGEESDKKIDFLKSLSPIDFSTLSFKDKRKYVLQVISKIDIGKTKERARHTIVTIHCKVDDNIYKYRLESFKGVYKKL